MRVLKVLGFKRLTLMFLPLVGYFFKPEKFMQERGLIPKGVVPWNWRIFYILENTVFYFVLGILSASLKFLFPTFLWGVLIPTYVIACPLEYSLMQWKPQWFSKQGIKITLFEFIHYMYQSACYMLAGFFAGVLF